MNHSYMQYKGFGSDVPQISTVDQFDPTLGLLPEGSFLTEEQIASDLYQRMPDGNILSPFESNIERNRDFYIDDEFGQFLGEESSGDSTAKRIEIERTLKLLEGTD